MKLNSLIFCEFSHGLQVNKTVSSILKPEIMMKNSGNDRSLAILTFIMPTNRKSSFNAGLFRAVSEHHVTLPLIVIDDIDVFE